MWVKGNNYFIKRFDYCFDYRPITLNTSNPLSYYLIHKRQITNEEIKPPTYVESKKGNITNTISSSVDHTSFHKISFNIGIKKNAKTVSVYDLDFKTFDNGKKNMYYNYNQNTKLKSLIDQITALIQTLNGEKKFVEE